jgi:hypothetical protein
MEIAGIPERSRYTWREQIYWEEVGIHEGSRNIGKK